MVLRIFRSTICRPSNFHKPNFCTSYMTKTTRSDLPEDEMARRKEYQKIIDYTFGPPKLHDSENIRPGVDKEDSATNLMENLKDKSFHSTHAVLGHAHKSTQKGEELPQQDVEQDLSKQYLQETQIEEFDIRGTAHNAAKEDLHQKPSSQDKFGESRADSFYLDPAHYIGCPHYYRQMEAQMYDNFAQKYLRSETDEIDKLDKQLAKEMENLELPKSKRKGMCPSFNISDNVETVDTHGYHTDAPVATAASQTVSPHYNPLPYHQCHQWCNHCSQHCQPHPDVNDMTAIRSVEDNVEEVYKLQSNSQGFYEEILPLNVTQCSDLPLDMVPESIHSPIEELHLDEHQPPHFLLSAPLVQDKGVEWGDMSRKIIQPIDRPDTIFQDRIYQEPVLDTSLQEIQVEQTDKHMTRETRQPYNVNYTIVNMPPKIEPIKNQDQSSPLTKMNLIETNISEHTKTHQRSYAQAHLKIEPNTEPLKPWTEEKLRKIMSEHLEQQARVDPFRAESTSESERRKTHAVEQNFVHATPQRLEQQTRVNPSRVEHTDLRRTDSMARHCVHAPSIPYTEPKEKVAHPVDDIINNLHLDDNLSLSELLQRVRAINRLQYCRECAMRALSSKQCPPTDRPQCPPPPDCIRDCPPPEKPKCPPCPECPPTPTCPPPPPQCPPEPKCPPPKPKCPPEPKCPPPPEEPKCPSPCPPPPTCPGKCGCLSTDPHDPVTAFPHQGYMHLFCELEYFKELINKGLRKLKQTSSLDYVVFTSSHSDLDTERLQLNRVKDLHPWVPLPSWPYPVDEKRKKLQCPYHGCPGHKPGPVRPNCPPLPCSGFPKRLTFSEVILRRSH